MEFIWTMKRLYGHIGQMLCGLIDRNRAAGAARNVKSVQELLPLYQWKNLQQSNLIAKGSSHNFTGTLHQTSRG